MGCFFSSPEGSNSLYPGGPTNTAVSSIDPSAHNASSGDRTHTGGSQGQRRSRRVRDQGPLDQHINRPLVRHQWTAKDGRWTRRKLDRERIAFFDTRVTGREENWQTINAVLEILWDNPTDEGLATAQGILNASEMTLPTGNMAQGVYDASGAYYPLPDWVVCDPTNIGPDVEPSDAKGDASAADEHARIEETEAAIRREEKGKGVVNVEEQITIKARLSEGGQDINLSIAPNETVRSIIKRIAAESGFTERKIHLLYSGRLLRESRPLVDQGWLEGGALSAFVLPEG